MNESQINVHIGEVKTGTGSQQLSTILGSCIGIALLWPKRGIYGLAHCLLPKSPKTKNNTVEDISNKYGKVYKGRYVDQAIDSLISAMSITNYRDIRAVVAGGANMTQPNCEHPERLVGSLNTATALAGLRERKIVIVHENTGGQTGRRMTIDCGTGYCNVSLIPRPQHLR